MDEKKDYKTDELVYQKMRVLVELLNKYSDSYYNGESIVTDEEYDHLYNMLEEMEKQTGVIISGSPINKVGYEVKDNLDIECYDNVASMIDTTYKRNIK